MGEPAFDLPKLQPVLDENHTGTDESERMAGLFLLLSALPEAVDLIRYPGFSGLAALALPLYFGIGLLRGDDFLREWVFAACLVQCIIGPLYLFISHGATVFILASVLQNLALLALVSGRTMSKTAHGIAVAAAALGTGFGLIGAFVH